MKLRNSGFTLIELIIVIGLLGILMTIAIPSYLDYATRARRGDAKAALTSMEMEMEKWRANHLTYTSTMTDLGMPAASPDGYYEVAISNTSATTYTLQATHMAGGKQDDDDECEMFQTDQDDVQYAENSANQDKTTTCWPR